MTRRTRQIVAAVLAPLALLVALLAWGVSSPPGSSPDEDYHMGSIWCANGPVDGRCELTSDEKTRELPGDVVQAAACFAFHSGQAATCPLDETSMKPTIRGNWLDNGYPPVFYAVMSTFVGPDLSVSIILMRSLNALLFVGVLTALFFLLPLRMRHLLVWGALAAIVPLGVFLIPSVNPSSWSIIQASGLWLATWGFFVQTGRRKYGLAALAVILMVMGAGARSDSAAYGVLAVAVAVVLGWRRDRKFLLELILPAVLVVIAASLFLTSGQSGVLTAETERTSSVYSLIIANIQLLPGLFTGALGSWGLGWFDTPMPALVWVTTVAIAAGVTFWGFKKGSPRKWLALTGVAAGLVVVPMYILVREGVLVGAGVQPRYVYPMMIIFLGVALVGLRRANLSLSRVQLTVVVAGLSMANSLALHINLRRYITGLDGTGVNLDRDAEWWWNTPISPMTVWIVGSLAFAIALSVFAWMAWGHRKIERVIDETAPVAA
ncbi:MULTISPECIES: DUF2142 domain-containing protein [unclassified Microbacterium]|uniref:DUF2142 domain-containing protein n=1 Tax=unclassified Microbacterium TaxID=2609290 RepID=UPI003016A66D